MPQEVYEEMLQKESLGLYELSEAEQLESCELREQMVNPATISTIHEGQTENMTTITFAEGMAVTYPMNYTKFIDYLAEIGIIIHSPKDLTV